MMSLPNVQPIEKQQLDPDGILEVHSIFKTIQGEGPFAGTPAVFVRLAGCNLQCSLCDTDYTSNREKLYPTELIERIVSLNPVAVRDEEGVLRALVVLTGGEPFRQNILPFVWQLLEQEKYYDVQIETNGTLYLKDWWKIGTAVTTVCSPKTGSINKEMENYIKALKYVVTDGKTDPLDGLPTDSLGSGVRVARPWEGFEGDIFIQPCDEQDEQKNKANMEEAVRVCMTHGYRLCVQTHKIANLP